VHEVEVLAIPEPGVDRSPRERPPLGLLARFAALDGLLQPPAGFFLVQQIHPAFLNDLGIFSEFPASLEIVSWAATDVAGAPLARPRLHLTRRDQD
jgi:hypothetical protein